MCRFRGRHLRLRLVAILLTGGQVALLLIEGVEIRDQKGLPLDRLLDFFAHSLQRLLDRSDFVKLGLRRAFVRAQCLPWTFGTVFRVLPAQRRQLVDFAAVGRNLAFQVL
ncbi:hypothetical protein [Trinickia acidisoli]|uniref:hypothetical protein n=1 Tax=Trinickia acidisoli TaxID=2767482 RepID=UPI001F5DC5EE|nr:hypothetical protein [Trinickia acidisoli]